MSDLESQIESTENIYQYLQENVDIMLEIFSKPEFWPILLNKIYNEYKNNSDYIFCSNKYKNIYKLLILNNSQIYFKLTQSNNESCGFKYKAGLNVNTNEFNPLKCCSSGGLFFCKLEDLYQFEGFGNYLTPIIVPKDIPIYQENCQPICKSYQISTKKYNSLKAPCVYVLPRFRIDNEKINQFIVSSAATNALFAEYMLYKSVDKLKLERFLFITKDMAFWYKERELAHTKIRIFCGDIYLPHLINLEIKDKFVIDTLINKSFPKEIEKANKFIKSIPNLNLDPQNYLKWFKQDEIEFFKKLGIVCAGSSILKYVTNKKFKPNDIDLYINISDFNIFSSEIMIYNDLGKFRTNYNMKNIVKVLEIHTGHSTIFDQYGNSKEVLKRYQLIVVDIEPDKFIRENFDFDLCAIGFDFRSRSFVNITEKPDYCVLTIQPSYINKMCCLNTDTYSKYRANKTISRIIKYLDREFYIENWKEFLIEIRDKICKF